MNRPIPYKGELPFIFVSYAHKDANRVWPIVERMQADGYRVWYDEGIDPGTEWDENIAAHVADCGYFIALLSENYMASNNCKDELNFAREQGKPRLLVYLEDVNLPQGMALRLGRIQAIFMDRYQEKSKFYQKLYEAQNIDAFRDGNLDKEQERVASVSKTTRRKKYWPVWMAILLSITVTAAAFLLPKGGAQTPVPPDLEPTSNQQEEPDSKSELKPVTNVVLVDGADMKVTVLGTQLDSRYYTLMLSAVNKSTEDQNFSTYNSYLNGVAFDPDQNFYLPAGEDTLIELQWNREIAQQYGIDLERVTVIELRFGDEYHAYYPYGEENVQRTVYTPTEQDLILLDTPEYLVVARNPRPHEPGTIWQQEVVWVNRTEKDAVFRVNRVSVNGYSQEKDWLRQVRPQGMYFGEIAYSRDYQWLAAAGERVLQMKGTLDIYQSQEINYELPIFMSREFVIYPEGEKAAEEVLKPREMDPDRILAENSLFRIAYLGIVPGQDEETAELLYLENLSEHFIDEYVGVEWYDESNDGYYSSEGYALQPHARTILQAERGKLEESYWLYACVYHSEFMHPEEGGGGSFCVSGEYRVQPPAS